MALARQVIRVMDIQRQGVFLDFGCARGYLVKALRRLDVAAYGCDISEWAIQNCDPEVKEFVSTRFPVNYFEHIWLKDVAEHLEPCDLKQVLWEVGKLALKSVMLIVPLEQAGTGKYVREEDNFDKTHKICWTLEKWMDALSDALRGKGNREGFAIQGSWHIPGLKPTSLSHPKSCGFITLRRI